MLSQSYCLATRSAGIIVHNGAVLVMKRMKADLVYYCFPGGTVEEGELPEVACMREIEEETSISVMLDRLLYHVVIADGDAIKHEYFYACAYRSGVPALRPDSIEVQRCSQGNMYQPMWMAICQLSLINLYPLEIRDLVIAGIARGFKNEPERLLLIKADEKK